ncbi:uncharacterized protein LOC141936417 [Strix uralensis]|uniref:uncharacterized protein LOC141936417 n=1 Tax=Strix uralensis TaxID=36305 RepID=UPI003DA7A64E
MGTCLITAVPEANSHPTAQPDLLRGPQGDPTDVAGGDGSAASQLGSRADAQGDRTGPQRAKYNAEMGKSSQWASEVVQGILKELDRTMPAQGMDRESMEKEVFGEGGSQAVPASAERTGAMQSAGVQVLFSPGEAHHDRVYKFLRNDPGTDGKGRANAADPMNFRKYCVEGALAVLGSMLLGMVFCCVICVWRKRKRRLDEAWRS